MAEGTRFLQLEDIMKQLATTSANHSRLLEEQQLAISDLANKIAAIDGRLEEELKLNHSTEPSSTPRGTESTSTMSVTNATIQHRVVRLEFPRFDGVDPAAWTFKAERFFQYHNTSDDQRLMVSSFHMDGAALQWFQWMSRTQQIATWQMFVHALEVRFGPSAFEDPRATLAKLQQITTVSEYQSRFETLANQLTDLPNSFLISCFISGLKSEIRHEVMALQPQDMATTVGLARLQESKLNEMRRTMFEIEQSRTESKEALASDVSNGDSVVWCFRFTPQPGDGFNGWKHLELNQQIAMTVSLHQESTATVLQGIDVKVSMQGSWNKECVKVEFRMKFQSVVGVRRHGKDTLQILRRPRAAAKPPWSRGRTLGHTLLWVLSDSAASWGSSV